MTRHFPCRAAVLSLCLLLGACGLLAPPRQTPPPEGAPAVRIHTDRQSAQPLPAGFLAASGDLTASPAAYAQSELLDATTPLHLQALLYPGGPVANLWQWQLGTPSLEQAMPPEALAAAYPAFENWNAYLHYNLVKGGMPFDDYLEFCRAAGIQPFCTVNLPGQSPEQSAAWMQASVASQLPVTRWRLGHRPWEPATREAFPGIDAIFVRAEEHASALRDAEPALDLALDLPASPLLQPEQAPAHEKDYLRRAGEARFTEAFAVTLPPLPAPADFARRLEQGDQALLAEGIATQAGRIEALTRALRQGPFADRRLWLLTEPGPLERSSRYPDSLLQALQQTDLVLDALTQAPQLQCLVLGSLPRLAGLANALQAEAEIHRRFRKQDSLLDMEKIPVRFEPRPYASLMLALVGEQLAAADRIAAVQLQHPPNFDRQLPALHAAALLTPDGGLRLLLLNRSPRPVPARLTDPAAAPDAWVPAYSIGAESLASRNGIGPLGAPAPHLETRTRALRIQPGGFFVPAYSLLAVELPPAP